MTLSIWLFGPHEDEAPSPLGECLLNLACNAAFTALNKSPKYSAVNIQLYSKKNRIFI